MFSKLTEMESFEDGQYIFKYSFFEIYNEKIYDMLSSDSNEHLSLRETKKNTVYVDGLIKRRA